MTAPSSSAEDAEDEHYDQHVEEVLPLYRRLHLGVSRQYYSYANALGLTRLQEYLQGAQILPSNGSIWLLGEKYKLNAGESHVQTNEKVMAELLSDFSSRIWMTYRKGFPPIGIQELTSDAGWGCTLRSGQMLLAQAILHHTCGRQWRRAKQEIQDHCDVAQLLSQFRDEPGSEHPYSVHNLVLAGRRYGIVAGEWLGPWTLCSTLTQVVNKQHPAGLHVHLANTPGGSAPVLYTGCIESIFGSGATEQAESQAVEQQASVLILIPLVLGIGKVNPRYIPQLKAVLKWPHSVGIVGGRPSSSLYFVGHQENNFIYLDPHTLQECGTSGASSRETYFCGTPRAMTAESIDPSLAIGFYCRTLDSFNDLAWRLGALEADAEGAPLINIVKGSKPKAYLGTGRQSSMDPDGQRGEEPWELL